ncbi:MAG TPA: ATP-dependent RecD-like DNA helicase [Candidatus Binatia bacterium]|nr:ATP-dependent RecD-like DNA helicase [Candidatus Binatia bacterium]
MAEKQSETTSIQGTVGRITYQHPETHYTVARLDEEAGGGITIVGTVFPVSEGEEIKVTGTWKRHPRYGLQFQVDHWIKVDPATREGIEKYLGSGLIKGIGPTYAKRLVAAFGLETLQILSEQPLRVMDVEGIGDVRARRIIQAWQQQRGMQDVMVFLQGHGVGASLALRIYRVFGADTITQVRENPYALAQQVHGIGFLLADRLANQIGIRGDFPLRVQAGVLHVLREMAERGHCFAAFTALKQNVAALLNVDEDPVEAAIGKLAAKGDLVLHENENADAQVYLDELYQAERRIVRALQNLLSTPSTLEGTPLLAHREWPNGLSRGKVDLVSPELFAPSAVTLDEEQMRAAEQALKEKVLVITGGPGTGKTTLLTALLAILNRAKLRFALAAPTGRAAKRICESTGEDALTIHRLLEYNPRDGGFQRNEENPLEADFIIVDETSMVDLPLMDHLLRAIDPRSHLILLGDVDQLPSVGPGSVLRDFIDSGVVPKFVLRRIFRQDRESLIVANAHRILQGKSLWLGENGDNRDFAFIPHESEDDILMTLKTLVREQIPLSLQLNPNEVVQSIQVLTPMHRGMLGTVNLNKELQALLNSNGATLERAGSRLRAGDKVMQLRNNYEKGVFNGDLGRIASIDPEDGSAKIDFIDRVVEYDSDELDEITLAYATSVHKSQGSEYPVVVIPLHTSHYVMLHRSILYTAVTRGKKLVVIVGSRKALAMAIRNVRVERRNTGLTEKLRTLIRHPAQVI